MKKVDLEQVRLSKQKLWKEQVMLEQVMLEQVMETLPAGQQRKFMLSAVELLQSVTDLLDLPINEDN